MIKMLILQQWHDLSYPNVSDRQMIVSPSGSFPDYLKKIPDRSTIWLFRERMSESGTDTPIWNELQRQLEAKRLTIKQGMIQDALFNQIQAMLLPTHRGEVRQRREEAKTGPG
ncbi:MAG: transposase [Methanomicrobiales archaeon]|jgi:IS5 family transposase|nr:transposase [Methanomicrobiales archaeon]